MSLLQHRVWSRSGGEGSREGAGRHTRCRRCIRLICLMTVSAGCLAAACSKKYETSGPQLPEGSLDRMKEAEERIKREKERNSKDLADARVRRVWRESAPAMKAATLKEAESYFAEANRLLADADFQAAYDAVKRALDGHYRFFPCPVEEWRPLPGTYDGWSKERATRELEFATKKDGGEKIPIPLQIQDQRLYRLKYELFATRVERYLGRLPEAQRRLQSVHKPLSAKCLYEEARVRELSVCVRIEQIQLDIQQGLYDKAWSNIQEASQQALALRQMDLVADLDWISLNLCRDLGRFDQAEKKAGEIAESARCRGDMRKVLQALLVQAEAEAKLHRWGPLYELLTRKLGVDDLCREATDNYFAESKSAYFKSLVAGSGDETHASLPGVSTDQLLKQAVQLAQKSPPDKEQAELIMELADRWLAVGNMSLAEELYSAVEEEVTRYSANVRCWASMGLGRVLLARNQPAKALSSFSRAADLFEQARIRGFVSPVQKAAWADRGSELYESAIGSAYLCGDHDSALAFMERSRARNLRDRIISGSSACSISPGKQAELDHLDDTIAAIDLVHDEANVVTRGSVGAVTVTIDRTALEQQRKELVLRRDALRRDAEIEAGLARHVQQTEQAPADLAAVEGLLDGKTVGLMYFFGKHKSFVSIIWAGSCKTLELDVTLDDLAGLVSRARRAISNPLRRGDSGGNNLSALQSLSLRVLGPVEDVVGSANRVIVLPHGPLHFVPFGALVLRDGRFVVEQCPVIELQALGILRHCRKGNRHQLSSILAVGNPSLADPERYPPLPEAEIEARSVSSLFKKATLLTGSAATATAVRKELGNYDILHFCTHGEMSEWCPEQSAVLFASDAQRDGALRVGEIRQLHIAAGLVTLSACETGLSAGESGKAISTGDDLIGLTESFISAGATSVLCSLWKVADQSTSQFMSMFYKNLQSGADKAQALRQAQLTMMQSTLTIEVRSPEGSKTTSLSVSGRHPFYWAPFVLYGDWE